MATGGSPATADRLTASRWRWGSAVRSSPPRDPTLSSALRGHSLAGDALEIGGGSGSTAEQLLDLRPQLRLTVTNLDPAMLRTAAGRPARFGDRAVTCHADVTRLPFASGSFAHVLSFIVLPHVIDREAAQREAVHVLKPGARSSATTCCRPRQGEPSTTATGPPTA